MTLQPKHVALSILLVACIVFPAVMLSYAYFTNEGFGFPLDDPWIHLQFAGNLQEFGSFSYYQDDLVTSGSTAPLYTLLLAAGFFLTNQEMILSYALGILFLLFAAVYFYRILEHLFPKKGFYAFAGTLLLILEPRLQWAALSGMETTLFVYLLLATTYHWMKREVVPTGIFAGLLLWTRPEAVILYIAMGAEAVYEAVLQSESGGERTARRNWYFRALGVLTLFGLGYAVFNYALSGSLLPNTYAAKLKYYSSGGQEYLLQVFRFLTHGHLIVFSLFVAVGIGWIIFGLAGRRQVRLAVPLLFSIGMILAYWIKLPYLYQNGRYLMPVIPFVLLIGLGGLEWLIRYLGGRTGLAEHRAKIIGIAVFSYLGIHFLFGFWEGRAMYQDYCKYISDRQVRTAHWIRNHLPADAIVATHDVGAIAYYSERRIVDMVGLISPEMIENIGNLDRLKSFLIQNNVTHLALLRNWFEVVNIRPVFQTNEQTPEIMEVFEFNTEKAHFTTSQVAQLTDAGWHFIMRGDVQKGGPLVERAVQLDSLSSRAHHHFGWALTLIGEFDRAEEEFRKALNLYPDYWIAKFALAQVSVRRGRPAEAIGRLEQLIAANPVMLPAYQSLAQVYGQVGDTARARQVLVRLQQQQESLIDP